MKSGLQKHKILAMASNLLAKVFVSVSKKALLKVPQHLIVFFSFVVSLSLSLCGSVSFCFGREERVVVVHHNAAERALYLGQAHEAPDVNSSGHR